MLYIHQFPDWTHFRFDYKRILDMLGKTRLKEGELIRMMRLRELQNEEIEFITEDIVANAAIDGIDLDKEYIRKEVELREESHLDYIRIYVEALKKPATPVSMEALFKWHAALSEAKTAELRTEESEIRSMLGENEITFKGPEPERLATELANFLTWFEIAPMDGIVKAAIAHFWLLTLRPFKRGNGMLARAICALQIARAEQSPRYAYTLVKQIHENRNDYFRILNKTQAGNGDLTEWILWFLVQMQNAIAKSEAALIPIVRTLTFAMQHAGTTTSEREQKILTAALHKDLPENFTSKDVATLLSISHDTAHREIQDLIEKKLIKRNDKRGRSQSYSLAE